MQVHFLHRNPDAGAFLAKGSRCRYVSCKGIQMQVHFLWRDSDTVRFLAIQMQERFFAKGSRCRYIFAKESRCRCVSCKGIKMQVRFLQRDPDADTFLRRDPDAGMFFAKRSKFRYLHFLWRDPDAGTFFVKGSTCRYVFCEEIQIQVRFLWRDSDKYRYVNDPPWGMGLSREDLGYGYGRSVTAQSIAQGPLQILSGGWVWTQAPTQAVLAPGILWGGGGGSGKRIG